jgi:hypothetical protein
MENKISKICWNTEGWKFPSGSKGKSAASDSFEAKHGYGHEEWLFDKSRIIDVYHYAFLQPLNVKSDKHVGKLYNISLFTVTKGVKYFVGEIKNANCISKDESRKVFMTYKRKGWLGTMTKEIAVAGGKSDTFLETAPEHFFNVKFKFDEVFRPDELEEISSGDTNIKTTRYKLLSRDGDFNIATENFDDESDIKKKDTSTRHRVFNGASSFDPYHDKIQNALSDLLNTSYKTEYKTIKTEKDRVDIMAKTHDNKWHYFEIKTNSPKLSIREALGQIMEYSYWPDSARADKLIIISDGEPDSEARKYLAFIRNKFNIPVVYRSFDIGTKTLSNDF